MGRSPATLLLLLLRPRATSGDVYTYPVKSINLTSAATPLSYNVDDGNVGDPHPVHGIETSDGGHVLVGKGARGTTGVSAFAIKLNTDGTRA
eukprot:3319614-Prymnesium_polylepis.3